MIRLLFKKSEFMLFPLIERKKINSKGGRVSLGRKQIISDSKKGDLNEGLKKGIFEETKDDEVF